MKGTVVGMVYVDGIKPVIMVMVDHWSGDEEEELACGCTISGEILP